MNLAVTDPHTDPHSQNSVLKQLVNYRLVGFENWHTVFPYRGFESPPLRQFPLVSKAIHSYITFVPITAPH